MFMEGNPLAQKVKLEKFPGMDIWGGNQLAKNVDLLTNCFLLSCLNAIKSFLKSHLCMDHNCFPSTLSHWYIFWNWWGKAEENIQKKKKKSQTQTKQTICLSILGTWLDLSGSFHLKLCFRWCVGDSAHQHLRGEEQVPPFPSEF